MSTPTPTPDPWIADGYDLRQKNGRMIAYFGPHHTPADEYPLSCRLQDEANAQWVAAARNELAAAQAECERLKFATEGHLLKTIQQQAELARLRAELKELSQAYELNRVSIDELDADRARAERAEAALAKWSVLNLWGGTPEIIHEFIKGQQNRIHHCQDLEAECLEQARLLGMSGEREADLLGKIERLAKDKARLDWLLDRSAQTNHSYSNPLGGGNYVQYHKDRAAIDAAMKP